MPATADRRSGHEQRDVRAPGHAGQPRDAARARRDRARAGHRAARLAGGVRDRPAARAARAAGRGRERAQRRRRPRRGERARHRGRHARADRRGALRRQPLLAGGWASRSPRRPSAAAPTSRSWPRTCRSRAPPGIDYVDVETAAELADACAARFDACDVLLMAAAVADYRAADRARRQAQEGPDGRGTEPAPRAYRRTCSPRSSERRRPGQLLVGFAAEHGEGALAYGRDKLARKKLDAVDRQRHRRRRHRLRRPPTTKSGSSRPTTSSTCPRRPRRGSPPRSSMPS